MTERQIICVDTETTGLNVIAWLAVATAKYGEMHDVTAMPEGSYVGREPIAELREMAPHMVVLPVVIDTDPS